MVPGYISLVVLIAMRVDRPLSRGGWKARACVAGWCFSLAAVIAVHHTEWFYPAIARWVPAPTKRWAAPFRLYEPTARLRGHQVLARAVAAKVQALQARGQSPFVLTATYGLTSTLSFYLPGQPETYCLSWNFGMTSAPVNQHDLWHPNPRHDPEAFKNRPAVVVEDSNMPPSYAWHMNREGRLPQARFDRTPDRPRARGDHRFLGHRDLPRLSRVGRLQAERAGAIAERRQTRVPVQMRVARVARVGDRRSTRSEAADSPAVPADATVARHRLL